MKIKVLFVMMLAMVGLTVTAQPRIAVLNFNAGVQVNQSDVDGLSAIFNTYFEPAGYIVVERTRVSRIIEEHNMQDGRLTEKDMVKLGEILNVPVIVIGDVNKAMGQYNVDVRAVNVETGAIIAKDGAEWTEGTSYRTMMRSLAERLSKNIPLVEFKRPEPKPEPKPKEKAINPTYRPTGGYLRISAGWPTFGSLAYNYQITPYFMVGGGAGISDVEAVFYNGYYCSDDDVSATQMYVESELRTPKYAWSLFLNLKVGATIPFDDRDSTDPIFVSVHGGVSYKNLHLGVGYTTSSWDKFSLFLSYSLPIKSLSKLLF